MIKNGETSITTVRSMKRFYTLLNFIFCFAQWMLSSTLGDTARMKLILRVQISSQQQRVVKMISGSPQSKQMPGQVMAL